MKKLYIVVESDFQYNDEINYIEGEGGVPIAAANTKQEAEAMVAEWSIDWVKTLGDSLCSFGYELSDIFKRAPSFLPQEVKDGFWDNSHDPFSICDLVISYINEADDPNQDEMWGELATSLKVKPYSIFELEQD